ncbi:hypothetical protein [Haladaptatus sp. DFWS20]
MNHPTVNERATARSGTARFAARRTVPKAQYEQSAVQTEET